MKDNRINYMKDFPAPLTKKERVKKTLWEVTRNLVVRWIPRGPTEWLSRGIYRMFGAEIPNTSYVYPSARVYMPWNLKMGPWSVIGGGVHVLNAAPFVMGQNCTVSERAYICCASHNIESNAHEQIRKPVVMKDRSWVAAEAFVGMGVTIGEGAVVGARAAVFKNVEPWTVVGGNPAKYLKMRRINETPMRGGGNALRAQREERRVA